MTETPKNDAELQIDASNGIETKELMAMEKAMDNPDEKTRIINQLQESVKKLEPNTIKKELEKAIKKAKLDDGEASKIIEAYKSLFGNPEATEKAPTADSILMIKLEEITDDNKNPLFTPEEAFIFQQKLSKVGFQDFMNSPEENKIAFIKALAGATTVDFNIQTGDTIINFEADSLVLNKEERKKLKELMAGNKAKEMTVFLNKQLEKTSTTAELLKGLKPIDTNTEHPLKGREQLVNNIDNGIYNALERDLPNMPADIRRNMATGYTIAMLDYVGSLPLKDQEQLAKDLEPKGENMIEGVLNMFKKLSVNKNAGNFFNKYDDLNNAIKDSIPEAHMKSEEELRKYAILNNTTEFVKAFKEKKIPKIEQDTTADRKQVSTDTDMKGLTELLNSENIKKMNPQAVKAMDTLAKDLNSPGKDIHSMKNMLESGEYSDTIESLISLPVIGPFFKGLIDMGMKLMGYENGVDGYLDKMDDKTLKETSQFIIDDFEPKEDDGVVNHEHFTKGIFKDIGGIQIEKQDSKDKIHLHGGFAKGMKALGKDFKDNEQVVSLLNDEDLKDFINNVKGTNSNKINSEIKNIASEIVTENPEEIKVINLSKLSTLVEAYGKFTSENNKLKEKGKSTIKLPAFLEKEYPIDGKKKTEINEEEGEKPKNKQKPAEEASSTVNPQNPINKVTKKTTKATK